MTFKPLASLTALGALLLSGPAFAHDDRAADLTPAERAELESRLDATRERMRELAEQMSELSVKLADGPIHDLVESFHVDHDRAVLGVSIDGGSDQGGVEVRAVTPDGPADKAGIESGDRIVAIAGSDLTGGDPGAAAERLLDVMRDVEPGDSVAVTVERDGRRRELSVVTEPLSDHAAALAFPAFPDLDFDFHFDGDPGDLVDVEEFERLGEDLGKSLAFVFHRGPWSDIELVELTPALGAYFGVEKGLLVVRAPDDASLGLVDGDVIVKLDGEAVSTPRAFTRALSRAAPGAGVTLDIVRQRSAMTLTARVPAAERGADRFIGDDGGRIVIQRRRAGDD